MVRLFAEYFYHSHASLKQLQDKTLMDIRQHIIDVAGKWQQKMMAMPAEELHDANFLDRVKRSADYFYDSLNSILAKPIELTTKVETNNKQAKKRLGDILPELRQAWLSRCYLLKKIAEQGFTVSVFLKEKQLSMLDAMEDSTIKPKRRQRKKAS